MPGARIIKRYANRKLYDTEQSRYITLQEISQLVQDGVDVTIIDNKTNEDLTGVTLAHVLLEAEKRNERSVPLSTLTDMLRSRGNRIQKSLEQQVSVIREEAERTVVGIRKETGRQFKDLRERTNFEDLRVQVRDFMKQAQTNLDELQARVEERIHHATEGALEDSASPHPLKNPSNADSTQHQGSAAREILLRLDALEKRIMILEGVLATWAPRPDQTQDGKE